MIGIILKKESKIKVKDIAIDLINLYEERTKRNGFAFSADDEFQKMFDEAFVYQLTVDQIRGNQSYKSKKWKKIFQWMLLFFVVMLALWKNRR